MPFLNFEINGSRQELAKAINESKEAGRKPAGKIAYRVDSIIQNARTEKMRTHKEVQKPTEGSQHGAINEAEKLPDSLERRIVSNSERCQMLINEYLIHERGRLHVTRTLDQSYYSSIDTTIRDGDQVIFRFCKESSVSVASNSDLRASDELNAYEDLNVAPDVQQGPANFREAPNGEREVKDLRIFTVDQLWLWVIDESKLSCSQLVLRFFRRFPGASLPKKKNFPNPNEHYI
jgi:hypothetical protein